MATYDLFLAHAGVDKVRAKELYRLLVPELRVFLDWDREIPKAQRQSQVTAILVSRATDAAYYLREEISAGIAIHRARPEEHRVIPVYLDGMPREPLEIPYGLRVLHAIDLPAEGGMAAVAQLESSASAMPSLLSPGPTARLVALPWWSC